MCSQKDWGKNVKAPWRKKFRERYVLYEAELKSLFMEIYRDNAAFDSFRAMLYSAWCERPAELRAFDEARLQDPAWYNKREMLGMQMYVSAFAGTLQGVRSKLPYVQDCGVNYLHLMPLLESPKGKSDGGYAVSDFRKVQPELGTMEDLAALAQDCHKRGISVIFDMVMNHGLMVSAFL